MPSMGGVRDAPTPEDWFRSIPVVTKSFLSAAVAFTLMIGFHLFDMRSLFFYWPLVWEKFELWRLITGGIVMGPPSFHTFFALILFYTYSLPLEKNTFDTSGGGGSADYLWMLITCQAMLLAASALYFDILFTSTSLTLCIVYVWSRKNPNSSASFWGIVVQSRWIPWIIVAIDTIMGAGLTNNLLGIGVGHAYYFLVQVLPATHGIIIVKTPSFLITWLGDGVEESGVQRFAPPGATAPPTYIQTTRDERGRESSSSSGLRHRWGGEGRVLGSS